MKKILIIILIIIYGTDTLGTVPILPLFSSGKTWDCPQNRCLSQFLSPVKPKQKLVKSPALRPMAEKDKDEQMQRLLADLHITPEIFSLKNDMYDKAIKQPLEFQEVQDYSNGEVNQ